MTDLHSTAPDLFFAPCFDAADTAAGRAHGWYLVYPGDPATGEDDLYVGPFPSFAAAVLQSLEERPCLDDAMGAQAA